MPAARALLPLLALAPVGLLTAGCGGTPTVDRAQLEDRVSSALEKQAGSDPGGVSCPDDLPGKVGQTVRCTLDKDSDKVPLEVRVTSVHGDQVNFWIAPTVVQSSLEAQVSEALTREAGVAPDDISCPADLVGRVGEKMRCTLTAGSDKLGVSVKVTDVQGQHVGFDVAVDQQQQSSS